MSRWCAFHFSKISGFLTDVHLVLIFTKVGRVAASGRIVETKSRIDDPAARTRIRAFDEVHRASPSRGKLSR